MAQKICQIVGDGIGPEVMRATQQVLEAAGAEIEWLTVPAGEAAAEQFGDALPPQTLDAIREHRESIPVLARQARERADSNRCWRASVMLPRDRDDAQSALEEALLQVRGKRGEG